MERRRTSKKKRIRTNQLSSPKLAADDTLAPLEKTVEDLIVKRMRANKWYIEKLPGTLVSKNWPDRIAMRKDIGVIFIEFKSLRDHHYLSNGQAYRFAEMTKHGARIYVMRSPDDYTKVFKEPNWFHFTKKR